MTAPIGQSLDLQKAMVAVLRADADLQILFGGTVRLYQDVPVNPVFPYITVGAVHEDNASVLGATILDLYPVFDVWSRAGGFSEVGQIANAIIAALHERSDSLVLSESSCSALRLARPGLQTMRDPDGVTKHAVVTFAAHMAPL